MRIAAPQRRGPYTVASRLRYDRSADILLVAWAVAAQAHGYRCRLGRIDPAAVECGSPGTFRVFGVTARTSCPEGRAGLAAWRRRAAASTPRPKRASIPRPGETVKALFDGTSTSTWRGLRVVRCAVALTVPTSPRGHRSVAGGALHHAEAQRARTTRGGSPASVSRPRICSPRSAAIAAFSVVLSPSADATLFGNVPRTPVRIPSRGPCRQDRANLCTTLRGSHAAAPARRRLRIAANHIRRNTRASPPRGFHASAPGFTLFGRRHHIIHLITGTADRENPRQRGWR